MLRRGSMVRTRLSRALSYATGAVAAGGGGGAVTYLLNHPFTNADTGAITNGSVVPGATTGVLNCEDSSTGQVEVLSNAGKVTPTATLTQTGMSSTTA